MESKSKDEAELAHPGKEKDGSSDFELTRQKLIPKRMLRSSTRVPSRPAKHIQ